MNKKIIVMILVQMVSVASFGAYKCEPKDKSMTLLIASQEGSNTFIDNVAAILLKEGEAHGFSGTSTYLTTRLGTYTEYELSGVNHKALKFKMEKIYDFNELPIFPPTCGRAACDSFGQDTITHYDSAVIDFGDGSDAVEFICDSVVL